MSSARPDRPEAAGVHSMTGHGVGETRLGSGRVVVETRAVNHKFLDVRVRLPTELTSQAGAVEARVRESLRRGRIEVSVRLDGEIASGTVLDRDRARAAFEQLSALRDELRPGEDVPLSLLACVPELFSSGRELEHDAAHAATIAATDAACEGVWEMRRREGGALAEDIRGHLTALEDELARVLRRVPEVVAEHRAKLRVRLERLLSDTQIALDPGRLEHEVAIFADRSDIAEELSRLATHVNQTREVLEAPDGSAGKRLDFLLQEMSREANTIGSKSSDAELARRVVEMKTAISRMREQAQNVL